MLFNAFCVFVVQKEKKRERREEKGGVSKSFRNEEFQLTQLRWGGGGEGEESFLSKAERGGRGRGRGLMRPLHKLPSVDVISRPVICPTRPCALFIRPRFHLPPLLPPPLYFRGLICPTPPPIENPMKFIHLTATPALGRHYTPS